MQLRIKKQIKKLGTRYKETFLQRRYTGVQEVQEKMLNITNY